MDWKTYNINIFECPRRRIASNPRWGTLAAGTSYTIAGLYHQGVEMVPGFA